MARLPYAIVFCTYTALMNTALTDLSIRKLTPPASGQDFHHDASMPNFGVCVSYGGTKSFFVIATINGRRKRITIGRYPIISLAEARTKAKTILAEIMLDKYEDTQPKKVFLFKDVMEEYLKVHCARNNRPSTAKEIERQLRKHFRPRFKNISLEEIDTSHINRSIDRLLKTPSEANHAFGVIRKFFSWTRERGYIKHSPCEGMKMPAKRNSRDRYLNDDELRKVWETANLVGHPYGTLVNLLLLTGQRRSEIVGLKWSWIDEKEKTLTFPKDFTKTGVIHTIPLTPMMMDVFETIPRLNDHLYPAYGRTKGTFQGFSKCKRRFDDECPIDHWTLHDLRRTFATHLASLRVQPHIIERILNHSSGTISGVAAIYNRFSYQDEMREAMMLWEQKLENFTLVKV